MGQEPSGSHSLGDKDMSSVTFDWIETLEGETQTVEITYAIDTDLTSGERMVMYYLDGSGYPGSPPSAEITGARGIAITVYREASPYRDVVVSPKMAEALGEALLRRTKRQNDWESLEQAAFEAANSQ